jgi:hypothetical protein
MQITKDIEIGLVALYAMRRAVVGSSATRICEAGVIQTSNPNTLPTRLTRISL